MSVILGSQLWSMKSGRGGWIDGSHWVRSFGSICVETSFFSSFPEPYGSRVIISRHYYISTYHARNVKIYLSLPYSAVAFALAISQDGHATESMSGLRLKVTVKCAEVELL